MTGAPSADSRVFPRYADFAYPSVAGGRGVWLETADGRRILDACSGGVMTAGLGYGVEAIPDSAFGYMGDIAYMYNHFFTNRPAEQLARRLVEVAAPEMGRVRFVTGGSEANETALRIARQYHVDRGQPERWRVISPAQAYHGATMGTLALTGRPALQEPFTPYLARHHHLPPATPRFDPTGRAALDALDEILDRVGPETVSAFFCEPVSAASLPAYSPPDLFWEGLAEQRERHGFLICFDEVVTGMGRTGSWFAYQGLPIVPDLVAAGKMMGAGYAPLAAVLCREEIYQAIAAGSGDLDLGHTWDGAPLVCAVGMAVLDFILEHGLVNRVEQLGPGLAQELEAAVGGLSITGEVRGRGFLLGVEYVDPRDGSSIPPDEWNLARMITETALENDLLVNSSHPNRDGWAGDQTLLAPAFTASRAELTEMIERFAAVAAAVDAHVRRMPAGGG